ncbi:DUF2092 domain-containing protein [Aestuariibaculum suncheonense]|uniref:DUF2092 domain-containing protein n=1 Tax=Aestuariibaculum suncheonense TaxID=1028745 RepID=A0A8J6QG23_9FLAO|nr:DUF2092 domain-containing protein [Aestuariibaculum suncheonense]MBD0836043.1 DUF2092 domain-containing protein [Aestuariibaculum suncheonense]
MKKFLTLLSLFTFLVSQAQTKSIDSTAIYILDKMADIIGSLESVKFNISTAADKLDEDGNLSTYYAKSSIAMTGPNKFTSTTKGDSGNYGYWYNGEYVSYYSLDENNYVTLEAPETILTMIDSMHMAFDFKFPAADFFYPSFTDDLIEEFNTIAYKGQRSIDGETCFYITATGEYKYIQLWISSNATVLPKRLIIIYKNEGHLQFETSFSNWELNPNIPEAIYNFTPPPHASLISILAKS